MIEQPLCHDGIFIISHAQAYDRPFFFFRFTIWRSVACYEFVAANYHIKLDWGGSPTMRAYAAAAGFRCVPGC